jgi:hypothetical protein
VPLTNLVELGGYWLEVERHDVFMGLSLAGQIPDSR